MRSKDKDHTQAQNIKLFTSYRLVDSRGEKEMGRSKCLLNSLQSDRVSSLILHFISHVFTSVSNGFWKFLPFPSVSLSCISVSICFIWQYLIIRINLMLFSLIRMDEHWNAFRSHKRGGLNPNEPPLPLWMIKSLQLTKVSPVTSAPSSPSLTSVRPLSHCSYLHCHWFFLLSSISHYSIYQYPPFSSLGWISLWEDMSHRWLVDLWSLSPLSISFQFIVFLKRELLRCWFSSSFNVYLIYSLLFNLFIDF